MSPQDMTPVEIDTELAALWLGHQKAARDAQAAIMLAHRAVGDAGRGHGARITHNLTDDAALAEARRIADPTQSHYLTAGPGVAAHAIERYDAASARMSEIRTEAEPLEAEYARRQWTRYFSTQGSDAHTHASMECSTCNRAGKPTDFAWNPKLSGLSEAEAVAELGPIMCTVCYPSAPTAWTLGKVKPARCEGSGQAAVVGTDRRYGMRTYAQCTGCGERQLVTAYGVVRAHKPQA